MYINQCILIKGYWIAISNMSTQRVLWGNETGEVNRVRGEMLESRLAYCSKK